jgi:hypothetical protein
MLQQPKSTEISKGSTVGKTKITNLILSNFLFSYVFLGSPKGQNVAVWTGAA